MYIVQNDVRIHRITISYRINNAYLYKDDLGKIINTLAVIVISVTACLGQTDRHYTMFYGNAVSYNPGAAGMFNGDGRAFSSYRNQWSSVTANPYKTINFSMDGKMLQEKIDKGVMGIGFTYYRDKAGDGSMINSNFGLALSYAVEEQKDFYFFTVF